MQLLLALPGIDRPDDARCYSDLGPADRRFRRGNRPSQLCPWHRAPIDPRPQLDPRRPDLASLNQARQELLAAEGAAELEDLQRNKLPGRGYSLQESLG